MKQKDKFKDEDFSFRSKAARNAHQATKNIKAKKVISINFSLSFGCVM